jgi:hypothetical protein
MVELLGDCCLDDGDLDRDGGDRECDRDLLDRDLGLSRPLMISPLLLLLRDMDSNVCVDAQSVPARLAMSLSRMAGNLRSSSRNSS